MLGSSASPEKSRSKWMKVDEEGNYVQFQGFTIISNVSESNIKFWNDVFVTLSTKIVNLSKYYSLLPLDSYHMTTINLFTEIDAKRANQTLVDYVDSRMDWLKDLKNDTDGLYKIEPRSPLGLPFADSTIGYEVAWDADQDDEAMQVINLARKYNVVNKIPPWYHVTLAYQYKVPLDDREKKELDVVRKSTKLELDKIRQNLGKVTVLSFYQAKVCYFNDMTRFIPWEGLKSPFDELNNPY